MRNQRIRLHIESVGKNAIVPESDSCPTHALRLKELANESRTRLPSAVLPANRLARELQI